MSLREEFVHFALLEGSNVRDLCRRFGVSSSTGYKWINRYRARGCAGLADRSRRPHRSPGRTAADVEAMVLAVRAEHPKWGGRKIQEVLRRAKLVAWVPAASTITAILERNQALDPDESAKHRPFTRFERAEPNDLWQMDFKGHVATDCGRCHPLTVLDDHSRFSICLKACGNERGETVQGHLLASFRRYGLPRRIIVDNGAPWGDGPEHPYTPLGVWLLRLDVAVSHSRPYHPQTLGKDERFHRTLKAELLDCRFADLDHCQRAFDAWRTIYNGHRPHEALDMKVPLQRYRASPRAMPETLPAIEYLPDDCVRRVQKNGVISFKGRSINFPKAFAGYPIALRPTDRDGLWHAYFCRHQLPHTQTARYVPEQALTISPV